MSTSIVTSLTKEEKDLFYDTVCRLTDGLPSHELHLVAKEAAQCEAALEKEIEILEASLKISKGDADGRGSGTTQGYGKDKDSSKGTGDANGKGETSSGDDTNATVGATSIGGGGGGAFTSTIPNRPPKHKAIMISIIPPEYDATNTTAQHHLSTSEKIIASELSPLDRHFTVSALLGRLREPFDTPPPPHSGLFLARQAALAAAEKKKKSSSSASSNNEIKKKQGLKKYQRIINLKAQNAIYTQPMNGDTTSMLALVKRISNHRTATVFRKAVNPHEAPGYADRILFPSDMTLIKKMVLCGYINTFQELHQQIGLICHNCVKFNGRDSDYSMLTREFETYVDDSFLDFMQKQQDKANAAAAAAGNYGFEGVDMMVSTGKK
eukprot:232901_1